LCGELQLAVGSGKLEAAMSDLGLSEIGSLGAEGFEQFYNNFNGFDIAVLHESDDPIYGASKKDPAYPLFIHIFVDQFDSEIVAGVEVDSDGELYVEWSGMFDGYINWILGEFFGEQSSMELGRYAEGIWHIPTMIVTHIYCSNPETFEEPIVWAARFSREDYLQKSPNDQVSLQRFLEEGIERNQADAEKLVEKYGE
jgi:hypothetical protein